MKIIALLSVALMASVYSASATQPIVFEHKATVTVARQSAFDYIIPVPLAHIFKRYKSLPGVSKTNETEHWSKPGLVRTVTFDDGASALEKLTEVESGTSFSYHISGFTSSLRFLVHHIEGSWQFTSTPDGKTSIVWQYKVFPKHLVGRWLFSLVAKKDLDGMLAQALNTLEQDLNSGNYTLKKHS